MNNTALVNSISKLLEEQWGLENAEFQLIVINAKDTLTCETEVRYTGTAPLTLVCEKVSGHYKFLKNINYLNNETSGSTYNTSAQ